MNSSWRAFMARAHAASPGRLDAIAVAADGAHRAVSAGTARPRIAPAGASADSAAAADSSTAAIHVIRWRGADGTRYTLSGPVSIDELQRVRAALGVK